MSRDSAIRKVKALRALAERPGTLAEGEVARDRAAALIARFDLTEAELAPEAPRRPMPPPQPPPAPRPPTQRPPAPFGGFVYSSGTGTFGNGPTRVYVVFR